MLLWSGAKEKQKVANTDRGRGWAGVSCNP